VTLSWNFGDGTAGAAGAAVDHWFARPGTFLVTLTGADLNGASSTATITVTVTTSMVTGASLLVPVVLESGSVGGAYYTSELTIASRRVNPVDLLITYTASEGGGSGVTRLPLAPGQQVILPSILAWLRGRGLLIPEGNSTRVGTLLVTAAGSSDTIGLFVGARTSTPDPKGLGGTFGLFYPALTLEESATQVAHLHGLQQSNLQRSNLAVVNRGDAPDSITLRVTWLGPDGSAAGPKDEQTLPPGGWFQFPQPLALRGLSAGQARIEKISGASRFVAYGVLNDATTTDGSYLPMSK
jgi:PKD repeat protein